MHLDYLAVELRHLLQPNSNQGHLCDFLALCPQLNRLDIRLEQFPSGLLNCFADIDVVSVVLCLDQFYVYVIRSHEVQVEVDY